MKEFLSHYITTTKGDVLNTQGEVIGEHDGALYHTIGQRHGFRLSHIDSHVSPHYVVHKDMSANTITVSPEHPASPTQSFSLSSVVLRAKKETVIGVPITISTRYHQKPVPATLVEDNTRLVATLHAQSEIPSVGQSAVFYQEDVCVGGGIIEG